MITDVIFISALLTSLATIFSIIVNILFKRIENIEVALKKSEDYNNTLWVWCRRHLDIYYQFRKPGSPEPDPLPKDD